MCKSVHLVTICPVCFDPNPAQAGDNGQHFETILCPEAFHTQQACELTPDNNANRADRVNTDLPHAQYNKLAKEMCDRCGPFFKESSASMSVRMPQQQKEGNRSSFAYTRGCPDIYSDLLQRTGIVPGSNLTTQGDLAQDIYNDIVRHATAAPPEDCFSLFQDASVTNQRPSANSSNVLRRGRGACTANPIMVRCGNALLPETSSSVNAAAAIPTAAKATTAPGQPEFLEIAKKAGWVATDLLGEHLTQATKCGITEEFLTLIDAHNQTTKRQPPGYDWSKDPFLKTHYPRVIAKLIEFQGDPDSILNKPGSMVSAGPNFVAVTDGASGEVTRIDCSRPKAAAVTSGSRIVCSKQNWGRNTLTQNQLADDTKDICGKRDYESSDAEPPTKITRTTKIKESPNKVVKNTKAKNKTPTKKDAEGKIIKKGSTKKGAASPKKVTASPKKNTVKAKPKAAGKGRTIEERIEKEATPSPSGRSLRKR